MIKLSLSELVIAVRYILRTVSIYDPNSAVG